ncbi:hypothetical protein [Staphylococcus hominis]|uniref:hypothetical protein n=1 Tax=Staphylococcus hominis TaxID=1290 RepID=UPI002879393B|nr:hypothetical protein [Staphylococcus hominis]MDS3836318.1 hypothetical protein [Staphylococcus hominis]
MSELYEYNPGQISEEELAMIKLEEERFEQALRQRQLVNLYNKKVSKSEKIKVTYNKAGKAVYKL